MREFEYFLFENFDADAQANNPLNPRNFLKNNVDAILSEIARHPAGTCSYQSLCSQFGEFDVHRMIEGGILCPSGMGLSYDCPIFLQEDAAVLHREIASKAASLTNLLESSMEQIRTCCSMIDNGFPIEQNLYHILCGRVFDGDFFEYLCSKGALATSRLHPSGLDYLNVIYEKCGDLQALSDGLLCSYNRLVNHQCALQSFGDAQGNRFDFYRLFRLMEQGNVPAKFKGAEALIQKAYGGADKGTLLSEAATLIRTGQCAPAAMALLEKFGYMQNGIICVPVFVPKYQDSIRQIERIVENCLGEAMSDTLMELAGAIDITAVRHGVNRLEIANELYHILFGSMNEELVARKIVAVPAYIPGEGRYQKCMVLYES